MNRLEQVIDRLPGDVSVRLRLLKKRLHHDRMLTVMREHVHRGDHVVDVGANRGVYSLFLSHLAGPSGRVDAIDPFPINAASVSAATRWHRNVEVHCLAVSDRRSHATLHVPVDDGRHVDALARLGAPPPVAHRTVAVEVAPLDEVLGESCDDVSFVKCDVEGHERAVLNGAARTLAHRPVLVIEIEQRHHPEVDIGDIFDDIGNRGYEGYAMFANGLRPLDQFDVGRDQLAYVTPDFEFGGMPEGYVSDFVFVASSAA
jgi:FkbM family methyltransferase